MKMAAISRFGQLFLRQSACISRPAICARYISTSKKSGETASVTEKIPQAASVEDAAAAGKRKWFSYGFSDTDEGEDLAITHTMFFLMVTMSMIGVGYYFMYTPDRTLRDWAHREAYFELKRREAAGLPHVDPNYVDPSKIELPSDEELGETEIII